MQKVKQDTTPINQLIDELKSEDIRKRINSVNNLPLIASTLGPERSRIELIPFLQNELLEDEDEVLNALVDILSQKKILDLVGGLNHSLSLFPILESLCKVEESEIRNKASTILKQLLEQIDIKKNADIVIQMIKRLSENTFFLSKGPAALLIPVVYKSVPQTQQQEFVEIYQKFITDPKPTVRKYASQNFFQLVKVYPVIEFSIIVKFFNHQIKDEQDFVRLYLVDAVIAMTQGDLLTKEPAFIFEKIQQLSTDKSWRIKYYLCEKIGEIIKGIGRENFLNVLFGQYLKYLEDQEPELRSIAVGKIDIIGSILNADEIISKLMPLIKTLVSDTQNYVRISLASAYLALSSQIGKKSTTDFILPLFLIQLKDDDSEVRISLFKKLNEITKVLGLDTLSQSVIPALTTLATDVNWRIRSSSLEIITFFAKEIGKEFLTEKIILILMGWMQDKVFEVRVKAIDCVKNLVLYLGSPWVEQNVMPKILIQQNTSNYLHRQTVLFVISKISDKLNEDYLNKTILPVIVQLSKDQVPNVRMNVCKTILSSHQHFKDKEILKKILQTLKEDPDFDVKYFCDLAFEKL